MTLKDVNGRTTDPLTSDVSDPDVTMMLVLHDAFRRDLGRFAEALETTPRGGSARAIALRDHWQFFAGQLNHHHTGEDDALWPALRQRAPHVGAVLDQMVVQHAGLDVAVGRVTEFFQAFASGLDPLAREWLIDALYRAADLLHEHFAAEEEEAMSLVRGHLSVEEWDSFVTYQMQQLSARELAESIPWILDDQSAERTAFVLHAMSPQARQAYEQAWLPAYRSRVGVIWG